MNSLATEILDASADADRGDRRTRLRAAAASAGSFKPTQAPPVSPEFRRRAIASTRGLGPQADRLLDEERDRI